jgi:hypothetical protein
MPETQDLHPKSPDGVELDATFDLAFTPVFQLVFHHKAGRRGGPRSVNADYHAGLELLLSRLIPLGCSIVDISVDSRVALSLDPVSRALDLDYPIRLTRETDPEALRKRITRAQKSVARRADAKPGGGNDQKRIRISFTIEPALAPSALASLLVGGATTKVRDIPRCCGWG